MILSDNAVVVLDPSGHDVGWLDSWSDAASVQAAQCGGYVVRANVDPEEVLEDFRNAIRTESHGHVYAGLADASERVCITHGVAMGPGLGECDAPIDHTTCPPDAHTFDAGDPSYQGRVDATGRTLCNDDRALMFYCTVIEWYGHAGADVPPCYMIQAPSADIPVPDAVEIPAGFTLTTCERCGWSEQRGQSSADTQCRCGADWPATS